MIDKKKSEKIIWLSVLVYDWIIFTDRRQDEFLFFLRVSLVWQSLQ